MKKILASNIEALLFVAQRPLSIKKIAQLTGASVQETAMALEELSSEYVREQRGIVLMLHNEQAELVTNPLHSDLVKEYTKEEVSGELTRAGLETLTIIAYRGPLSKTQIEQIRGVNCTIVLRNLAVRGYIEMVSDHEEEKLYTASFDFLRHLGLQRLEDLPDYETLHNDERLDAILSEQTNTTTP